MALHGEVYGVSAVDCGCLGRGQSSMHSPCASMKSMEYVRNKTLAGIAYISRVALYTQLLLCSPKSMGVRAGSARLASAHLYVPVPNMHWLLCWGSFTGGCRTVIEMMHTRI